MHPIHLAKRQARFLLLCVSISLPLLTPPASLAEREIAESDAVTGAREGPTQWKTAISRADGFATKSDNLSRRSSCL